MSAISPTASRRDPFSVIVNEASRMPPTHSRPRCWTCIRYAHQVRAPSGRARLAARLTIIVTHYRGRARIEALRRTMAKSTIRDRGNTQRGRGRSAGEDFAARGMPSSRWPAKPRRPNACNGRRRKSSSSCLGNGGRARSWVRLLRIIVADDGRRLSGWPIGRGLTSAARPVRAKPIQSRAGVANRGRSPQPCNGGKPDARHAPIVGLRADLGCPGGVSGVCGVDLGGTRDEPASAYPHSIIPTHFLTRALLLCPRTVSSHRPYYTMCIPCA